MTYQIQNHQTLNHQTRVKICGITSVRDAEIAAAYGADAIGLVFYPKSPRYVSPDCATAIANAVGPFVSVVALFVNAASNEVKRILEQVSVQVLQFHGSESAEFCQQFAVPYIKAIKVPLPEAQTEAAVSVVQQTVIREAQLHPQATGLLLDALHKKQHGGTGQKFDWRCVPSTSRFRWILAGGLTPDNVATAIAQVKPYAVDVSTGVESKPDVKDDKKLKAFIQNAKAVSV